MCFSLRSCLCILPHQECMGVYWLRLASTLHLYESESCQEFGIPWNFSVQCLLLHQSVSAHTGVKSSYSNYFWIHRDDYDIPEAPLIKSAVWLAISHSAPYILPRFSLKNLMNRLLHRSGGLMHILPRCRRPYLKSKFGSCPSPQDMTSKSRRFAEITAAALGQQRCCDRRRGVIPKKHAAWLTGSQTAPVSPRGTWSQADLHWAEALMEKVIKGDENINSAWDAGCQEEAGGYSVDPGSRIIPVRLRRCTKGFRGH